MTSEHPSHRAFLTAFGLAAALMLAGVVALNWFFDPAGLFSGSDYEFRIAEALSVGKHVARPGNFDERLLQKRRSELEKSDSIDNLVIGSSRALLIDRHLLPGTLRNVAVSGAVIEDYVALWELWRRHSPKEVWVVADPWLFNRNHDQRQWESLSPEFQAGSTRLRDKPAAVPASSGKARLGLAKLAQLVNWEYTRASWLKATGKLKTGTFEALEEDDACRGCEVIASPGNRIPDAGILGRDTAKVRQLAEEFARQPSYLFKNYYAIDQGNKALLELLLADMSRQSSVVLVLAPVHPLVYDAYSRSSLTFRQAEPEIRDIARRRGIRIIGSFSPQSADCGEEDFYDGIHPMPRCIGRLVGPQALSGAAP